MAVWYFEFQVNIAFVLPIRRGVTEFKSWVESLVDSTDTNFSGYTIWSLSGGKGIEYNMQVLPSCFYVKGRGIQIKVPKLFKKLLEYTSNKIRGPMQRQIAPELLRTKRVFHNNICMKFHVPNRLCNYRVETFSSKEPNTLRWIDNMRASSVFWDVGSNVGLYSVYAAASKDCRVYAFEPSVFNLEILARNIYLNGLQEKIVIVPLALTSKPKVSKFKMSSTAWGGSLSTFGEKYDQNGLDFLESFQYQTIGAPMDELIANYGLSSPNHLKIDVHGIEHLVLKGGSRLLTIVESVLVELNDEFSEQASNASELLLDSGLILAQKHDLGVRNQYNQLWIRPS